MTPSWLEVHSGARPLLLFAPHGGRRLAPREPGRHKVNDLHTASLTRELASRWHATAIVNERRDRNEIDLNRISDVRRDAPWLPSLLAATLSSMVRESGGATLLVIHGWNAVQAVCDVGMGVVERDGTYAVPGGGGCTASDTFITTTIGALRRRADADDIRVTVGARYPAAHRNNLLQLFTPAHRDDEDPDIRTLAQLAGDGLVAAAQLELGIPLRWPGRFRSAFASALTEVFAPWVERTAGSGGGDGTPEPVSRAAAASGVGRSSGPSNAAAATGVGARSVSSSAVPVDSVAASSTPQRTTRTAARRASEDPRETPRPPHVDVAEAAPMRTRGIQFVAGDLLGFTSIDAKGGVSTAGRLLLSPSPGRLALFTGDLPEAAATRWCVPRLRFVDEAAGAWSVRYDGPLLAFPTLTPFLDLEHGLSCGELIEAAIDLRFVPAVDVSAARRFGMIRGRVELAHEGYDVAAAAVAHDQAIHAPRRMPSCRLTLPDDDGGIELSSVNVVTAEHAPPIAGRGGSAAALPPARFVFELAGNRYGGDGTLALGAGCTLALAGDAGTLSLQMTDGVTAGAATALDGVCERLIPVRRPGRTGAVIHTVYAVVRFAGRPAGWLELALEQRANDELT